MGAFPFDCVEGADDCKVPFLQKGESNSHFNTRKLKNNWICNSCLTLYPEKVFCQHKSLTLFSK